MQYECWSTTNHNTEATKCNELQMELRLDVLDPFEGKDAEEELQHNRTDVKNRIYQQISHLIMPVITQEGQTLRAQYSGHNSAYIKSQQETQTIRDIRDPQSLKAETVFQINACVDSDFDLTGMEALYTIQNTFAAHVAESLVDNLAQIYLSEVIHQSEYSAHSENLEYPTKPQVQKVQIQT